MFGSIFNIYHWHSDFMLHHHRFRDFLVLFQGFLEFNLWEPCSAGKWSDMSELCTCSKRFGASRSRLGPDGLRVHLSGPAYMTSCIRLEVRLPLDQRVLCSDCCKKCRLLCLTQVVFSYLILHSSKIPLVLATKVTHLRSLLFRKPDGVNCVVRRIYFGDCPKTE